MFSTIKDPRMQSAFGMLARALVPDAGSAIKADQARLDSNYRIAQTGDVYAQTALRQQELAQEQAYAAAQSAMAEFLASGADFSDPAVRGEFMARIARTENGMKDGPGFAAGATTYVQPQFAPDNDFSRIMLGTGVVNDWAGTPTGFAAEEAGLNKRNAADNRTNILMNDADNETLRFNNQADNSRAIVATDKTIAGAFARAMLEQEAATGRNTYTVDQNNQGEMDRLRYEVENPAPGVGRNVTPPTVTPSVQEDLTAMLQAALEAQFPGARATPAALADLQNRVATNYQKSRNAQVAVADAIAQSGLQQTEIDDWGRNSFVLDLPKPPDAMSEAPGQPPADLGVVYVNPETGEKITRDPKTGGWMKAD